MGWLIALAVIAILACLPLGVSAKYDDGGPIVRLILGPVRYTIVPGKKKAKKAKTEKKTEEKPVKKTSRKKKTDEVKAVDEKENAPMPAQPLQPIAPVAPVTPEVAPDGAKPKKRTTKKAKAETEEVLPEAEANA